MPKLSFVLLGFMIVAAYMLSRATPPVPPGATAADSAAAARAGISTRLEYGVGMLGSRIVGETVHKSVQSTRQKLLEMGPGIQKAQGGDGIRARQFADKIVKMNQLAVSELELGHPVNAVRLTMESKNLLHAVKQQIERTP